MVLLPSRSEVGVSRGVAAAEVFRRLEGGLLGVGAEARSVIGRGVGTVSSRAAKLDVGGGCTEEDGDAGNESADSGSCAPPGLGFISP